MEHERRIATWNPAPPRRSLAGRIADFYRPVLREMLTFLALPLFFAIGAFTTTPILLDAVPWTIPIGFLAGTLGAAVHRRRTLPAPASRLEALSVEGMPVTLHLYVDGYGYGRDKGEIALVDDWLIFEGDRTSFSLAPHDVMEYASKLTPNERKSVEFKLKGLNAQVRMWIIGDRLQDPAELIQDWTGQKIDYPSISLLPPLAPMPGRRRAIWDHYASDLPALTGWYVFAGNFGIVLCLALQATHLVTPLAWTLAIAVFIAFFGLTDFHLASGRRRAERSLRAANEA